MSTHTRNGFRWSVNEILSLQREFELLGWSIEQIAEKHKRTPNAIMYKLDQEGFACYNDLNSECHNLHDSKTFENNSNTWLEYNVIEEDEDNDDEDNDDEDNDDEDNDENYENYDNNEDDDSEYEEENVVDNLSDRVFLLEEAVSEIKDMLKQLMTSFSNSHEPKSFT
jgi:cobalamin biosynthesis protein CobT